MMRRLLYTTLVLLLAFSLLSTPAINYVTTQGAIININAFQKDLVDGSPVALFKVACPVGTANVVRIIYNETYTNATPHVQNHLGQVIFNCTNNGATMDASISDFNELTSSTMGTLTDTWTATAGTNEITINCNSNTSLGAATTFFIRYSIRSMTNPVITIL